MSSNDCDDDKAGFFLGAAESVLLSSLPMDNDRLSLMLFMVAATLGIALTQSNKG